MIAGEKTNQSSPNNSIEIIKKESLPNGQESFFDIIISKEVILLVCLLMFG